MCTCITYTNSSFYFGRNLDLEYHFGEQVIYTPRNYRLEFRNGETKERHYAMLGMAAGVSAYPLYAEAVNEKGLAMAGLNFPGNACYRELKSEADNVASFELIPWILASCSTVKEAREKIYRLNVTNEAYAENMPPAPLHWMLADRLECIVLEQTEQGLDVYENPAGVMTNNPPFPYHRINLTNYMNVTADCPENRFSGGIDMRPYCAGMGGIGLPGDASSPSRFVRAAFLKWNSHAPKTEKSDVAQLFHILDAVSMVRGSVVTAEGNYDMTTYSCCINCDTGIYYYRTYEDMAIKKVCMADEDPESDLLVVHALKEDPDIFEQNKQRKEAE